MAWRPARTRNATRPELASLRNGGLVRCAVVDHGANRRRLRTDGVHGAGSRERCRPVQASLHLTRDCAPLLQVTVICQAHATIARQRRLGLDKHAPYRFPATTKSIRRCCRLAARCACCNHRWHFATPEKGSLSTDDCSRSATSRQRDHLASPAQPKRGLDSCSRNTCHTRGSMISMNITPNAAPARCALWLMRSPPRRSIHRL